MDDSNRATAFVTIGLAAFTAYYTVVTYSRPPVSARPVADAGDPPASIVGDQFIPARLWQDPLDVEGNFDPREPRTAVTNLSRQVEALLSNAAIKACGIQVIAALVEGNPYPEDKEVRRRLRYALQRSLASEGYQPMNRSQFGVFTIDWPERNELEDEATYHSATRGLARPPLRDVTLSHILGDSNQIRDLHRKALGSEHSALSGPGGETSVEVTIPWVSDNRLIVPYEWFSSNGVPILVLWLREEYFADSLPVRLGVLFNSIFPNDSYLPSRFNVIGPRSSNTLKGLLDDYKTEDAFQKGALKNFLSLLHIFSCQATVPDAILSDDLKRLSRPGTRWALNHKLKQRYEYGNDLLIDCIPTDDVLARRLVSELSNRQLTLGAAPSTNASPVDSVALFYESDTAYGRSLARIFRDELDAAYHFSNTNPGSPNVHLIPYLRGVDGKLPRGPDELPVREERGVPSLSKTEKAEGDHQLDYIKRLGRSVRVASEENVSIGNERPLRAIGILGSDVYDKLLLLQVLRSEFPHAIYFTTDLDARLAHRDENTWARNLVVASAYSLEPSREVVFRDSYQSAFYSSCQKAIRGDYSSTNVSAIPALYEISRTGFVKLSENTNGVPARSEKAMVTRIFRHHSAAKVIACVVTVLSVLFSLLLFRGIARWFYSIVQLREPAGPSNHGPVTAAMIACLGRNHENRFDDESKKAVCKGNWWLGSTAGLSVLLLIWCIWKSFSVARMPGEEPLELRLVFDGISVWPTEWLRAFLIGFCWISIVWAFWKYRTSLFVVLKDYRLQMLPLTSLGRGQVAFDPPERSRWKRLSKWHQEWSITRWPRAVALVSAREWVVYYQERGRLSARLKRVILFALIFASFSLSVMFLGGFPMPPLRGSVTARIDSILLWAMIISLIALISYIVDVIRLTERLIGRLGDGKTIWPEELLLRKQAETGVDRDHLSGLIDVEFVANHTKQVNYAVYLPFVAIMVAGFARANILDRWPWPLSLKLVFVVYCFCAAACAWAIRRGAQKVRQQALDDLESLRATHKSTSTQDRISAVIEQIETKRDGAYNRWWADPAIVGMLIPPGSAGAYSIIKNLLTGG